ncbi:PREDICTED: uncharacterized protein LOC105151933 [Acromyrmex echinatior]|uniref:uncharacterized protein LOC105151933 n=1 Tax=Acromyrmex echinatior TaxID=103372 RepID=UPI000580E6B4|nr:PREDICTED: uncharacterized protein LOC105151933 [Acromyrmex echinatior]
MVLSVDVLCQRWRKLYVGDCADTTHRPKEKQTCKRGGRQRRALYIHQESIPTSQLTTYSSAKLEIHSEDYGKLNDCVMRLTSEDKWLSFDTHRRKERIPFVVYADLEYALEKMES